jgi:hypothetical protein
LTKYKHYLVFVSTAEKIFKTAQTLPQPAQNALLQMAELLAVKESIVRTKPKPRFMAVSAKELETKVAEGLDDLNRGNSISGKIFAAEMKAYRAKRRRAHA